MKFTPLSVIKFVVMVAVLYQSAAAQTTIPLTFCDPNDIDQDNDGLIEICSLEMLNNIRYQLDGSGYNTSNSTKTKITAGCPEGGCKGYELTKYLNFSRSRSYEDRTNQSLWFDIGAWQPIGNIDTDQSNVETSNGFSGIFEGNGYTITNLFINMRNIERDDDAIWGASGVGLFGFITDSAVIKNVGLLKVKIIKRNSPRARPDDTDDPLMSYLRGVGGLVGINGGTIINSYVSGLINGGTYNNLYDENNQEGRRNVGGLVGTNLREIINSYSVAEVIGKSTVGGLVGENCHKLHIGCPDGAGEILNSYARGTVAGEFVIGGLVGANRSKITGSYTRAEIKRIERTDIEDISYIAGGLVGENVNTTNTETTLKLPLITASYWQKDDSPLPDIGQTGMVPLSYNAGLSDSDLEAAADIAQVYSTWSASDWYFDTLDKYPILRYTDAKDTSTCSASSPGRIEPPRCGSILRDQVFGLRSINISPDVIWQPDFSLDVGEYTILVEDSDIEILNLELRAYDFDTEITIGTDVAVGSTETAIVLSGDTTKLAIQVGLNAYRLTFRKLPTVSEIDINPEENIKINADGMVEVDEGDEIVLSVDSDGDYRYMWEQQLQNPGDAIESISGQNTTALSVRIPTDFIKDSEASTASVTFMLTVYGDSVSRTLSKTLIVRKRPNGTPQLTPIVTPTRISILATPDADGDGTFTYKWQSRGLSNRKWRNIPAATTQTYWLPRNTAGIAVYRVTVKHKDNQGYATDYPILGPFRADVDVDDDGLIEIYSLEQLDAIRYQLDGSGYNTSNSTETKITIGCPAGGCKGYELVRHLNFDSIISYEDPNNKDTWSGGGAWQPIGSVDTDRSNIQTLNGFSGIFEGNGYTITNLHIDMSNINTDNDAGWGLSAVGLFGATEKNAVIKNVGLLGLRIIKGNTPRARPDSTANPPTYYLKGVGGLVGINDGTIVNSYVAGRIEGGTYNNQYPVNNREGRRNVGGLVGTNLRNIINSYSIADVIGRSTVGGLVGENCHKLHVGCADGVGEIVNSYAKGVVTGEFGAGGLVGANRYKITDSYARINIKRIKRAGIKEKDYIAGGLVGRNVNIGSVATTTHKFPLITASYWRKSASPLPDVGESLTPLPYTAGLSPSDLKSPTDATSIYSTWQASDWDFGTPNQFPVLRYAVAEDTNACSEDRLGTIDPPRCGSLLPDQGVGLRDLNISPNVLWQPDFGADTEYTILVGNSIETLNLQLQAYNADTRIVIRPAEAASGNVETMISLSADTTKLDIKAGKASYSLNLMKVPIAISEIDINPKENIDINADDTAEVDEGKEIILSINSSGDYGYMWEQETSNFGDAIESISGQDTSALSVRIPTDFIKDSIASTASVTFTLTVQGDSASRTLSKTLIVNKRNNGTPELTPIVTPTEISISATPDADGDGTFTYRWQSRSLGDRQWNNIRAAKTQTYSVPGDKAGNTVYRVTVKHKDSQGYATDYPTLGPFRADVDVDDDGLIEIYSLEQLDAIRYQLDGSGYNTSDSPETKIISGCASDGCNGYELVGDLDFLDDTSYLFIRNKPMWTTAEGWQPIGNSSGSAFRSTFEGNGFTISNLMIDRRSADHVGLFGYAGNLAEFSNISLSNVSVRGNTRVGSLVGYSSNSKINNIFVNGTVRGYARIGGLIGSSLNGKITNIFVNGTVQGTTRVGGLIGNSSTDKIINSSADGEVEGGLFVGGLIGQNGGSIIRNSFASSRVEGATWVGGLVGYMFANNALIINSYASGGCVLGAKEVGGLVGSSIGSFIRNSYATSCVEYNAGTIPVFPIGPDEQGRDRPQLGGGIVAPRELVAPRDDGTPGVYILPTVTDSYWRTEVTGRNQLQYQILHNVRLSNGDRSGVDEDELKSPTTATGIYGNWSTENWDFGDEENYPLVRYATGADKDACNIDPNTAAETTLPQCGDLLPNQRDSGLGILFLLSGDTVLSENLMFDDKPFSSLVFEYDYSAEDSSISDFRLIPFAINGDDATIAITEQGNDKDYFGNDRRSGEASETIPFDDTEIILTVTVTEKDDTRTDYTLRISDKSQITILPNFRVEPMNEDGTVNEGSMVSIIPTVIGGREPYSHEWTHTLESEHVPSLSGLNDSILTFDISESFVATDTESDINEVLFNIKVTDNVGSTTNRNVVLRVRRVDNGHPDIETEISATTFTVVVRDDPDGNGDGNFSYQWQERVLGTVGWTNTDTTADAPNTYTLPPDTPGSSRYRVLITHTDAQNHTTTTLVGPFRTNIDEDEDGLIEIYYLEDLDAMRYQSDGSGYNTSGSTETKITLGCGDDGCNGYELARELDFQEQEHYTDIENMNEWQTDAGWQPIIFASIFEGNDYTISNLYIDTSDIIPIHSALFNRINEDSEVRNVGLTNIDIKGFARIGGLAATNAGSIINSYVTGAIAAGAGTITGHSQIGGLVGDNRRSGRIINSHAEVDIIASGSTEESQEPGASYVGGIGGLVGINQGEINGSYAKGDVTGESIADVGGLVGLNEASIANNFATGDLSGNRNVGGLIGTIEATTTLVVISNSFATGDVYGSGDDNRNIGGLIGNSQGNVSITNTYANGQVSGSSNSGGLIGLINLAEGEVGTIVNNYTTSLVAGTNNAGGLIGTHEGNTVSITASYWQNDASELPDAASEDDVVYATSFPPGQSAEALKMPTTATGIYSGWSTADWNFGSENEYPILAYGVGSGDDPTCDTDPTTVELPDCDRELDGQRATLVALSIEESEGGSNATDYSEITLSPMFLSETLHYEATLKRSTKLVRINPTPSNSSSTVSFKIGADAEMFEGLTNDTSITHTLTAEELSAETIDIALKLTPPSRSSAREGIYTIELIRIYLRSFGIRTRLFLEGPFR